MNPTQQPNNQPAEPNPAPPQNQPMAAPVTPQPAPTTAPAAGQAPTNTPAAGQAPPMPQPERTLVSWNAPEFIYTHKPAGWYVLLGLFFAALIVIAILTRQWLSIAVFAVMGVAVTVYANRKPRMLMYSISNLGVQVGEKHYDFNSFSAFFEADDYGQLVFELVPTKRFSPLVSMPAPDNYQEQIEQSLSQQLPKNAPRTSVVERLFKALRF